MRLKSANRVAVSPVFYRRMCSMLFSLAFLANPALLALAAEPAASSPDSLRVPVLQHVGVLPLVLEAEPFPEGGLNPAAQLETQRRLLAKFFPELVRAAERFHVIHDEVVAGLWPTVAGRKELADDYELSAYVHLQLSVRSDLAIFTQRLLGPELQPYLQESEVWPLPQLLLASPEQLEAAVADLLFRLLNRLPVDIAVSSVQGSYLTLTGGRRQGLALGAEVEILRAWVSELHPSLQTWRRFRSLSLGRARIVDLQEAGAIAQLQEVVGAMPVRVGDGLKSSQIPSRVFFARRTSSELLSAEPSSLISAGLAPLAAGAPWQEALKPSPAQPAPKEEGLQPHKLLAKSGKGGGQEEEGALTAAPPVALTEPEAPVELAAKPLWYRPKLSSYLPSFADEIALQLGAWAWTATGTGAGGSRLSWYSLVNRLNVELRREVSPHWHLSLAAGLGFGKSRPHQGGFFAYEGLSRLYWEDAVAPFLAEWLPGLKQWSLGGLFAVSGLGISASDFGGYDSVEVGLAAGLKGHGHLEASHTAYEWLTEFSLLPVHLQGQVAYHNVKEKLHHSSAWQLLTLVYEELEPQSLEWGVGASVGSQSVSGHDHTHTTLNHYTAYLLARVRL